MQVGFTKMHGAGNDFVVLDQRVLACELSRSSIMRIADRRLGIGCDQIILLGPAALPDEDATLRFFNADGSESAACGNGTRCAAALLAHNTGATRLTLRGRAGLLTAELPVDGEIRVDLGPARLGWRDVPLTQDRDTLHLCVASDKGHLSLPGDAAACSIGNPHATLFVHDLDAVDIALEGAALERHGLFAEGANIGFAQILGPSLIRLAVWERGAGATLACGSGACAAVVNGHRRGLVARDCAVEMPGGRLHVSWRAEDQHVLLSGPTVTVFTGHIAVDA